MFHKDIEQDSIDDYILQKCEEFMINNKQLITSQLVFCVRLISKSLDIERQRMKSSQNYQIATINLINKYFLDVYQNTNTKTYNLRSPKSLSQQKNKQCANQKFIDFLKDRDLVQYYLFQMYLRLLMVNLFYEIRQNSPTKKTSQISKQFKIEDKEKEIGLFYKISQKQVKWKAITSQVEMIFDVLLQKTKSIEFLEFISKLNTKFQFTQKLDDQISQKQEQLIYMSQQSEKSFQSQLEFIQLQEKQNEKAKIIEQLGFKPFITKPKKRSLKDYLQQQENKNKQKTKEKKLKSFNSKRVYLETSKRVYLDWSLKQTPQKGNLNQIAQNSYVSRASPKTSSHLQSRSYLKRAFYSDMRYVQSKQNKKTMALRKISRKLIFQDDISEQKSIAQSNWNEIKKPIEPLDLQLTIPNLKFSKIDNRLEEISITKV